MTRIAVVEDDARFRAQLVELLNAREGWEVVSASPTAEAALAAIPDANPDLVLLDIQLPGDSGIDVLPALRVAAPAAAVVVLTIENSAANIVRALTAGAVGYIQKGVSGEALLREIEDFLGGGAPISPSIARRLIASFHSSDGNARLTERQHEILRLAARGKAQKHIAEQLGISLSTVKNHCQNIYERLGVHSLQEALAKLDRPPIGN